MITTTILKILFACHILKEEINAKEIICDIFINRALWFKQLCLYHKSMVDPHDVLDMYDFEGGLPDDRCRMIVVFLPDRIHCVMLQGENTGTVDRNVRLCNGSEFTEIESNDLFFANITFSFENCPIKPGVFYMYEFLPFDNVIFFGKTETAVLRNDSFQGICSVNSIDLHDNKIKFIQSAAFSCITNLTYLNLSKNLIESLPEGVFERMSKLTSLDLSQNHLKSLTVGTFHDLDNLMTLWLSHNHLKNISQWKFPEFNSLRFLDLSYNPGLILEGNLFQGLYGLLHLNLDNCNISLLPNKIFEAFLLDILSLKNNQLKSINQIHFVALMFIRYLDLSQNFIQEVSILYSLKYLVYLNISHNLLTSLPGIEYYSNLQSLDISYNIFTDIRDIKWHYLKDLMIFIVTNNVIEQLFIPEIKYNLEMHLEENKIRFIHISRKNLIVPKSFGALELFLSGNSLQCDCNAYELFSMIKGENSEKRIEFVDGLTCQHPKKFYKMELDKLNSSDFKCSSCPVRCQCEFHVYDYIENKINCSDRNYEEFPVLTSQNASVLDVSQNRLKSLAGLNQSCWENLIELNAEDNEIKSDEFYIPESLVFLGLKGNEMSSLPRAVKEHAEKKNYFKMTLSRNRWPCDCSVKPFKDFISNRISQIIDINDIRCISPNKSISRVALLLMEDSDICPPELRYFSILSYTMAALFLAVTIVITVYYRNKTYLQSFMYTHCRFLYMMFCCNCPKTEKKMFDCFISYSSKDSDVAFTIVEELENNPPTYKFCVHERNWIAGEYITNNIVISVQNSRKTLIILSKEFVKSQWFHLEFRAAFRQTLQDKQNRLIFVLKGELPDKNEMEKDLLHVLSTVTYLKWGERWFWEKLRYALHESKSFVKHKPKNGWSRLKILFRKDDKSENPDLELSVAVNNESLCETYEKRQ